MTVDTSQAGMPSRVTRGDLHPELIPFYGRLRVMEALVRRKWFVRFSNRMMQRFAAGQDLEGLDCKTVQVPARSGTHAIRTRIYRPPSSPGPLPAVLYCHGGGYLMGIPENAALVIRRLIATRACVVVAPDYRKSLADPFPAGFDDCYDTLLWMRDNPDAIGSTSGRIILVGHSAGGGLTAALSLKARDERSVPIAFQLPVYPMIDDLQPEDEQRFTDAPVWNTRLNRMAWDAYLAGVRSRGEEVSPYAAPARNAEQRGLPPTITLVGTLDPFYRETCAYVESLRAEGIPVEFRTFDGCFHAFELLATETEISKEALGFLFDRFAVFFDRYALTP